MLRLTSAMMTPLEQRLTEEVAAQRETIRAQQMEIKLLREKVDLLVRRLFGAKSEQLDDQQLKLLLQAGDEPPKKAPASGSDATGLEAETAKAGAVPKEAATSRRRREPRVPEHLPVVEQVIEPEEVKAEPQAWRCMGREVTEQLDYEPAKFLRRRLIRPKYVRREQPYEAPVIAPLNVLQERGIAAPGLLAAIIVGKYCDHLPLYRQEQIWRTRHGIELPRQSLARWVALAADWLTPLYDHIRTGVMAGGYVQVDETPVKYLSPGNGQTRQGYLWTCKRPGGEACFSWATSRASHCLEKVIPADFSGVVQCDGYAAYPAHARSNSRLMLAACWAHVRRKFIEARDAAPMQAGWVLLQLAHLYRIEAQLRHARAGPRLCQARRGAESRPIITRLRKALEKLHKQRRHLPRSAMGRAVSYALSLWPLLEVYVEDGRVRIDNNEVENAIRPTAIGKKNWLFIGEAEAGQRSAILYTIIEACRNQGIDPWAYLRDVLTRLPTMTNRQVKDVLPAAWAKARKTSEPLAA